MTSLMRPSWRYSISTDKTPICMIICGGRRTMHGSISHTHSESGALSCSHRSPFWINALPWKPKHQAITIIKPILSGPLPILFDLYMYGYTAGSAPLRMRAVFEHHTDRECQQRQKFSR